MGRAPARLKRRPDFLRVAASRRKWVTPGLILQIRAHDESAPRGDERAGGAESVAAPCRVGLTVSRKVGGSVERNRARRRLRAAVEEIMPAHAAPGHDYVVIGRGATVRRPYVALKGDLEAALRGLGAWRDGNGPDGRAA